MNIEIKKLDAIKTEIHNARFVAKNEGNCHAQQIFSRGTFLSTCDSSGSSEPQPQADCVEWKGTLKEIKALIAEVEAGHPDVTEIWVGGGYDGAENSYEYYQEGLCDPWVSSWDVLVWAKDGSHLEEPADPRFPAEEEPAEEVKNEALVYVSIEHSDHEYKATVRDAQTLTGYLSANGGKIVEVVVPNENESSRKLADLIEADHQADLEAEKEVLLVLKFGTYEWYGQTTIRKRFDNVEEAVLFTRRESHIRKSRRAKSDREYLYHAYFAGVTKTGESFGTTVADSTRCVTAREQELSRDLINSERRRWSRSNGDKPCN